MITRKSLHMNIHNTFLIIKLMKGSYYVCVNVINNLNSIIQLCSIVRCKHEIIPVRKYCENVSQFQQQFTSIDIKMFTRIFFSLMFLLQLTDITNAQFEQCNFENVIEEGRTYYVYSPAGYPNYNYRPGTTCRWTVTSDRPINMSCNFEIPQSNRCSSDVIVIKSSEAPGLSYCGTGTLNIVSSVNRIVMELYTTQASLGGQFLCSLQTANIIPDNDCTCGRKKPTRIVGGNETEVNEYPMMAGLVDVERQIMLCGATIINPRQVVTAAHCVDQRDYRTIAVVVGEHDTSVGTETDATQFFRASGYAVHPQYSDNSQDYDIAIVGVDGEIEFNELVGPVCLPFQHSQDSFAGDNVDILGWGSLDFGERRSNTLQKAEVNVLAQTQCSESYNAITVRQICTLEEGKDSCQFDSGGPVLWSNPETKNVVLVGIINYGLGCGGDTPAVNSRVSAYIDWIQSFTPEGFEYCDVE